MLSKSTVFIRQIPQPSLHNGPHEKESISKRRLSGSLASAATEPRAEKERLLMRLTTEIESQLRKLGLNNRKVRGPRTALSEHALLTPIIQE
jgi:hypothetical protein